MTAPRACSLLTRPLVLAATLLAVPAASPAQRATDAAQVRTAAKFREFDATENGYLSGTEIDRCGCRALDANGDGVVSEAEYVGERGPGSRTATAPRAVPTSAAPAAAAAPGPFGVGERVLTGCYGNRYEGLVERVDGDRRWVRFDPAQSSCDGWRETAQLAAAPPVRGTRGGSYAVGAPVEARSTGRWHSAVVLASDGGRYRVHYESYASSADEWLDAASVRQTPERAQHRTGSGGSVPVGTYGCYNYSAGSGLRYQTGLKITGPATYADVAGTRGAFAKDAAGVVRFRGGAFGGSQGEFQYNAGRAMIYMHVPSSPGKRAGMDCEGPKP
ncbi:MAG: agenet domain-containing protein [Gemmatirosa sp.]